MSLTGGCRCGACRYTLDVDVLPPVYCCHCRDCQKWSGSAFVEQALIRSDAITATGPLIEADVINPSGSVGRQSVCSVCHSRLWSESANRPGMALLRAGTLDDNGAISPRAHIWVRSKQDWVILPSCVATFEENAPPAELIALLLRR